MSIRMPRRPKSHGRALQSGQEEAVDRFCQACVSYHETRARFLPGEAPELIPPGCFYRGSVRTPGWCGGASFQEGIP